VYLSSAFEETKIVPKFPDLFNDAPGMEHYYTCLFHYIEQVIPLPESDKASIRRSFKPLFVPRDTIIEPAGQVPQYHNFIASGYMRNFHLDRDGHEIITDLNDGPRFFTSYGHFMNRTVSNESLHCITDCELLRINRDDVDEGAKHSTTQKDFTIHILQKHLQEDKERMTDMANLSAEERYLKFLKQKPNIVRNVPLRYIASYLGITQRHLSRLRGETGGI
jgi:CRP-like cAMP-binding protein